MNEFEGTVDDNDQGPWVWSGDGGCFAHAYSVTHDGVAYLQSPRRQDAKQGIADAIIASRQGQTAWMAHYSSEWSDMHTWLQGLSGARRTKLYQLCRGLDDIAALLA